MVDLMQEGIHWFYSVLEKVLLYDVGSYNYCDFKKNLQWLFYGENCKRIGFTDIKIKIWILIALLYDAFPEIAMINQSILLIPKSQW